MAQDTSMFADRIVHESDAADGAPVVKSTQTPVATVLEKLAANPDVDALLRAHPGLTVDDVSAVFAYLRAQIAASPDADAPEPSDRGNGASGFVSPQDFYREAVQRDDIRRILDALAK